MDKVNKTENEGLDVIKLLLAVVKKWAYILVAGILCAVIAFCYSSFYVTPLYRARSTMLIDFRNSVYDNITTEQINIAEKYSTTIAYVMKTSAVLEPIVEELDLNESPSSLASKIHISEITESLLLSITLDYPDGETALKILEKFDDIAPTVINEKITSCRISNMEKPTVSSSPVTPNVKRSAMLGFIFGALAVVITVAVLDIFDNKIKSIDDLSETVDLPILAVIPATGVLKQKGKGAKPYV